MWTMRILLTIIMLGGFLKPLKASDLSDLSLEDFLQLERFYDTIELDQIDTEMIELGVWHLSNVYRLKNGKLVLEYDVNLDSAAQLHSNQMQHYGFFAHDNKKNKAFGTLYKRAEAAGYINWWSLSENIYSSYISTSNPPRYIDICLEIVQAFIDSKGHRENLLSTDVNEMGCGIQFDTSSAYGWLDYYFTENFGRR